MSIIDFESGKPITGVLQRGSRGQMYQRLIERLSEDELSAIRAELDDRITGQEIITAGWLPGNDWRGTPFQPIYERAANQSVEQSGLMFGLLVWEAFERHPDDWFTGRFELNGVEIGSRTYWRPTA